MAIYLFFDESGNLDFTVNGSRYYFFGILATRDPGPLTRALTELRYELISTGLELESFHAAEDNQSVRNQVFARLRATGGFDVDFMVVDKRSLGPENHDPLVFYPHFGCDLLTSVLQRYLEGDEPIIIVTDQLPLQRQRKAAEKAFRTAMRHTLGERTFSIIHHSSAAHAGLQAVDYCTWAVQRKWQKDDLRSYQLIEPWVRSEKLVRGEDEEG